MSHSTTATVLVHAPHTLVWRALTEPALVKQYFFGTNLETTWAVGSNLFFRGEWNGKKYEDRGTVLAFEPERSFSYDYWSAFSGKEDKPELRHILRFELTDTPEGVRVDVRQSNIDTQEQADHSKKNWDGVLAGLKKFVEAKP
ncbi:MAG TPA: SRPBCC domain-containing protein [Polyangiaceae bacterium]|nr:SRPBCC domain-containing protein [Polyangiaceae bacterium]